MLVFGDRTRTLDPREALERLDATLHGLVGQPAGLARHAGLAGALIAAGELAQGLADASFENRGEVDARSPAVDLAQALTCDLAMAVVASWRTGFTESGLAPTGAVSRLRAALPSDPVTVRTCEGYAFYAVYPELYAEAAALMAPAPRVVGLRSIGTSLAAAAAAGCGAPAPLTLRPCGDTFVREVRPAPGLAAELAAPSPGGWAVVDEGPGLSGSSFAAVATFLQAHGAAPSQIAYLPSHGGEPGSAATAEVLAQWRRARRPRMDFDATIAPRLAAWSEPLVGRPTAPLEDLSGGRWRGHVPPPLATAPAWPESERRKFRLTTDAGSFLLKFAGLGASGEIKLARARALHARGFAAEPVGLVHGFLVERWSDAAPLGPPIPAHRGALLDQLAAYLAFRARGLAPPETGAATEDLRRMMVRNLGLAGLGAAAEAAARLWTPLPGPPAAVDGRLHRWEWRVGGGGRLLKTDALDHAEAHDLIGAQDLAWDLAGAAVEFSLSADEAERLRVAVAHEARAAVDPRRVAFQTLAYLAFQLGAWRMAAEGCEGARAAVQATRYEDLARGWRPA